MLSLSAALAASGDCVKQFWPTRHKHRSAAGSEKASACLYTKEGTCPLLPEDMTYEATIPVIS